MALSQAIEIKGMTSTSGYIRVVGVVESKINSMNTVMVATYANADVAKRINAYAALESKHFPYEPILGGATPWGYARLKTLPEFAGAIDV